MTLSRPQWVGGAVGLVIGVGSLRTGPVAGGLLRLVGYVVACTAIARWVPIVREGRVGWMVGHEAAVAAICIGFAMVPRWTAVGINGAWGVIAFVWWAVAWQARRSRRRSMTPVVRSGL